MVVRNLNTTHTFRSFNFIIFYIYTSSSFKIILWWVFTWIIIFQHQQLIKIKLILKLRLTLLRPLCQFSTGDGRENLTKPQRWHNFAPHQHRPSPLSFVNDHSPRKNQNQVNINSEDFLMKKSFLFGFEQSLVSERMATEADMASSCKYQWWSSDFWSKRPLSLGSHGKPRVFSFWYYRGIVKVEREIWQRWEFVWLNKLITSPMIPECKLSQVRR